MKWSSFKYLARQGLHNMINNRLMSFASVGVLTVCLIITGVAGLFTANMNSLMLYLRSQNEVVVYLDENLDEAGLASVDSALRSISGLKEVTYVSKDEALDLMRDSMGDKADLFDVFEGEENPFLANYKVVLQDVGQMDEIVPQLESISGVVDVNVPTGLSDLVVNIHKAVTVISVGLVVVLGFVSIVVISNTIRLTVFARRKEINIMKYVGATNGFIRLPFFVEGIAVGLIAGLISSAIVLGGYQLLIIYSVDFPAFWGSILNSVLLGMDQVWWKVLVAFLAFGSLIGSVGTATSIRKYLHV
ncbi:permease-like cell division protein FtsX [Allofournierella massiliensis]|uniref:Cell division protein FtsX n=1 Tax=Allofournierella massiliensis TaxID=1650663 RepID=A0A4R1R5E4_9FIRM|nr:permease-like cell division protein FtsX [Fournierella massiliensis]TCL60733.1 cell division transport system permease protein [Fournierella massiliensis]